MDEQVCGLIILFGGIIFWVLVFKSIKRGEEERTRTLQSKHRKQVKTKLGEGGKAYSVVYKFGHKGIDHYLKVYIKKSELPGTLSLLNDGIQFICPWTRTEQKFKIQWNQVRNATNDSDGWLNPKSWLRIHTNKYETIGFITNEAVEITSEINFGIKKHREEIARQKHLEKIQIEARNLDVISPTSFENLVGQLFKSMGYFVTITGGTGDQGVDLDCRTIKNEKIIVQCKRYKGKVGVGAVRDFYGALVHSQAIKGYIVTTSEFTTPARKWSSDKPIELIDRKRLAELLNRY